MESAPLGRGLACLGRAAVPAAMLVASVPAPQREATPGGNTPQGWFRQVGAAQARQSAHPDAEVVELLI